MEGGISETGERFRTFAMSFRGQRKGPLEVRQRSVRIEPERTLPGEGQEVQRRCLDFARLLDMPGGPS